MTHGLRKHEARLKTQPTPTPTMKMGPSAGTWAPRGLPSAEPKTPAPPPPSIKTNANSNLRLHAGLTKNHGVRISKEKLAGGVAQHKYNSRFPFSVVWALSFQLEWTKTNGDLSISTLHPTLNRNYPIPHGERLHAPALHSASYAFSRGCFGIELGYLLMGWLGLARLDVLHDSSLRLAGGTGR